MKQIKEKFRNFSLRGKIFFMVAVGGILPVGIIMAVSLAVSRRQELDRFNYTLDQGYNQVYQAIQNKFSRIHNISTLLAVNNMVNLTLQLDGSDPNIAEQLAAFENINSYAYGLELTLESSNIVFYIEDSYPVVNAQSNRYRPITDARGRSWYGSLRANNGQPAWVNMEEGAGGSDDTVAIVRELWNPDDYSQSIGVLAIATERKNLEELLRNSYREQVVYLETSDGKILAANVPEDELFRLPLSERKEEDENFRTVSADNTAYYARSKLVSRSNVYLVSLIPKSAVHGGRGIINNSMGITYLLINILLLLALGPTVKSVTGRLKLLKEQMMQIQNGNICKVEASSYNDEIGQLIGNYNAMVDRVEELMKEQYVLGQEKVGAELKALQSQINPHFLYNTLDMINWMAQKNETDNIQYVVQAMSRFYRMTLNKGNDVVAIRDELRMCEAYMEIQKKRYKGRILFEIEVEEEILDCLIPKITMQPFLENAVIHGINEKDDARGIVILNGWLEDGRITLSVTDDGNGMTEEDKKKNQNGSHYGMKNIEKRLKLFYGEEIPVQIESSLGIGTCVIINIPVKTVV